MKARYGELTKDILLIVAAAGILAIAATSPYFLINLARVIIKDKKYNKNKINERNLSRSLKRLEKNRFFILRQASGKFYIKLSEKGEKIVQQIKFDNLKITVPKKWDKQWRIIIFDIPEKGKKRARDALRIKLREWKFYQLQKSVWVCPYPCEEEIQVLCDIFKIGDFVNIITANKIDNDKDLKKYFHL